MCCNKEIIKIVLRKIHEDSLWLDQPFLISKEALRDVIGLCCTRKVPALKLVKNEEVNKQIGVVSGK